MNETEYKNGKKMHGGAKMKKKNGKNEVETVEK